MRKRILIQGAVVIGLGALGAFTSPRKAQAMMDPNCLTGCCICVPNISCDDFYSQDVACGNSFCGPPESCWEGGCSSTGGATWIECSD